MPKESRRSFWGAVDLVSGRPGSAEDRTIPVVVTPPGTAYQDTAGVIDELKAFARISIPGDSPNPPLMGFLAAAVSEFETLTWRAFLRQTREQVLPPDHDTGEGYADGYYGGPSYRYGGTGGAPDRGALRLDEPYEPGTARVYAVNREGEEEARVLRELPAHGMLWADWPATYARLAVRVRYEAGWQPADIPADLKTAVFGIAHALWDREPDRADDARMLIMKRYARRRRPSSVAVGTMDSGSGEWL